MSKVDWNLVVIDEAQAIKNVASKQTRAIKKLHSGCRNALTGTPVENQLGDLLALFDFCCPGLLGSSKDFKQFVKRLNSQSDFNDNESGKFQQLGRICDPISQRQEKVLVFTVPELKPEELPIFACG